MITAMQLAMIAGKKKIPPYAEKIAEAVNHYARQYGVTEQNTLSWFLANVSVETFGFSRMDENLNYSAKRLVEVWPNRFKSIAAAKPYANNPLALANKVYGGRMGNDTCGIPNAGWLFRGSGPGQTTGYYNFKAAEDETGIPFVSKPDLMRDPVVGTRATLILWKKWKVNDLVHRKMLKPARKLWNGGTHGYEECVAAYNRAMKLPLKVPPTGDRQPTPAPEPARTAPPQPPKDWDVDKGGARVPEKPLPDVSRAPAAPAIAPNTETRVQTPAKSIPAPSKRSDLPRIDVDLREKGPKAVAGSKGGVLAGALATVGLGSFGLWLEEAMAFVTAHQVEIAIGAAVLAVLAGGAYLAMRRK